MKSLGPPAPTIVNPVVPFEKSPLVIPAEAEIETNATSAATTGRRKFLYDNIKNTHP